MKKKTNKDNIEARIVCSVGAIFTLLIDIGVIYLLGRCGFLLYNETSALRTALLFDNAILNQFLIVGVFILMVVDFLVTVGFGFLGVILVVAWKSVMTDLKTIK